MPLTPLMPDALAQLNAASEADAAAMLAHLHEHTPWIAAQALKQRPFASWAHLKHAMAEVLRQASPERQLDVIRAHPELAGKAMVNDTLTAESTDEQSRAGLTHCTPEAFAQLQQLNAAYNAKFGFPFILAVRGPRGTGLTRAQIIQLFARRLNGTPAAERAEALRQINRIVEIRLAERFGDTPELGHAVWDWHERLAQHSEPEYQARGELTVTYLTDAHRACARQIEADMREAGFDTVHQDAMGNVVGIYQGSDPAAKTLLTGSHYDTVRNGGKYDGRLGICVPLMVVRELHAQGKRLPFAIEVVAFAEEEGQRFPTSFLTSSPLAGSFEPAWLGSTDANGVTLREAMLQAGLNPDDIPALKRDAAQYLGFIEVHIEQGPVLAGLNLPLGVVTSINGSLRYLCEVVGLASHAGTTPMNQRHDAACAVAEIALFMEQRAAQDGDSVATMGQLQVPNGSVNVLPGRCVFSMDLRAPTDPQRDALMHDVMAKAHAICERRGVQFKAQEVMRVSAAPSAPEWQARWETAVAALGLPVFRLPSGAGHDAMKLHEAMPQAMLFVRGENGGISHNPLESTTSDDMQLAVQAFAHVLEQLTQAP